MASVPNGSWIEVFPDTRILNVMKLFRSELEVRDGLASASEDPGLGVEFDDRAVDEFAVDAWG